MKFITLEDLRDIYLKIAQRGYMFILSKLSLSKKKRTKSSFNNLNIDNSNWWIIPIVRKRWNYLITGNNETTYEEYVSRKYKDKKGLRMISLASGICSHELRFAKLNPSWKITCIDFSEKLLRTAKKIAEKEKLTNIEFLEKDIYEYDFPDSYYDIVLFHQSLHHFKDLRNFIEKIYKTMTVNGKLLINEFVGVNRLQYEKFQLREINQCLKLIDKDFRKIFKTDLYKNRYYGSGVLRMILSDPSECIASESILPAIKSYFKPIEEKGYGGNLLMPLLKDISHHFVELDESKKSCIEKAFEYEDNYLKKHKSDFIFGIYEKILPVSSS